MNVKHLAYVLERAAKHKGVSFVEIYQNCNIFNDGAFQYATGKETKNDTTLYLEDNKPLVFGGEKKKGIRLNGMNPEIVELGDGVTEDDLLFHDEQLAEPSLAYLLSRMHHPEFPEPMGVFRCIERPSYEGMVTDQINEAKKSNPDASLENLFAGGDTWEVK